MRTAFSSLWRIGLIALLVASPLFVVYRSKCREDGKRVDEWSLVAPWDDPPSGCRNHQNGFEILRDEVGL